MQFVVNGPDIPDALLQAHEEGRVVFFCGAGISSQAGLPSFKGLVEQIYNECGETRTHIEENTYQNGQFDATLDLLERRITGGRLTVRRALAKVLKPDYSKEGAMETHTALLRLALNRDDTLRLVTTNFDRIFHDAAISIDRSFESFAAPMLPVPKRSRWDGLVFIHGLLSEHSDDTQLNQLVVTSGDFGLAYLTERWAARFMSEVFRNYSVCFIGYGINDPVLRYMMDALAADRMMGEVVPKAWAFGSVEPGLENETSSEWDAKGVTSILYEVPADTHDHSALHQSLHAWAETYRDGVQGKEAIVVKHASNQPMESTQQDNFVGRMLWALADKSGLPAKRFAEYDPAPPLDWLLGPLCQESFDQTDLNRFGTLPSDIDHQQLCFSLVRRPASYHQAPWMQFVSQVNSECQFDDVMFELARWLTRHLNDPRLIIWLAERGGRINHRLHFLIDSALENYAKLEHDENSSEFNAIRSRSPMAIPNNVMKKLWRLMLSGHVKSDHTTDIYNWHNRLKSEGLTTILRLELRELLAPKVTLKEPFRLSVSEPIKIDDVTRVGQVVNWELVLRADHVRAALQDLASPHWKASLHSLLEEFQLLLKDALDLARELDGAEDYYDRSTWDLPSISEHWQNHGYHDWVLLIELLRDAWIDVNSQDKDRGSRIAQSWFELPYPTFKRLAFFAASYDGCINPDRWVAWLLEDERWWLWSSDISRERFRLLVLQGRHLQPQSQAHLEEAILAGPPRKMYQEDIDDDRWQSKVDRAVWLQLSKLRSSRLTLGEAASKQLGRLSTAEPGWHLEDNESDEFSTWMSGTGDPDYEDNITRDKAPRELDKLVDWLLKSPSTVKPFHEDDWDDVCRSNFSLSFDGLRELAKRNVWPAERWRVALNVWSEETLIASSWKCAAPLVLSIPDSVIMQITHNITGWMKSASKGIAQHEHIMLELCSRILGLDVASESGITTNGQPIDDPVLSAINHPIGHVTEALINVWFSRKPKDSELLPQDIEPLFTALCDTETNRFRHGRVLLGSRLLTFYRVDKEWTKQHLLKLFSWEYAVEAKSVWEGFLWSPRLYLPLMISFKQEFLASAKNYNELGKHKEQFAIFLTHAILNQVEGYTDEEFRESLASLPVDGLEYSAQALAQTLEGAADRREDYWRNRIQPFWQKYWPKSQELLSASIARSLTRLIIATGSEFPTAQQTLKNWLQPIDHPHFEMKKLNEAGHCNQFPDETLLLLDALFDNQRWAPRELGPLLQDIAQANLELQNDNRFRRLRDFMRTRQL